MSCRLTSSKATAGPSQKPASDARVLGGNGQIGWEQSLLGLEFKWFKMCIVHAQFVPW